jgi:hypothetical protein
MYASLRVKKPTLAKRKRESHVRGRGGSLPHYGPASSRRGRVRAYMMGPERR